MTKIGEGGEIPQRSEQMYRNDLQNNIVKFEQALTSYPAASSEEKAHFNEIMKQQMALIKANVKELKTSGAQKQAEIVGSDYDKFSKNPTGQNLTALQQDMDTLKEYGLLP